MSTPDGTVRAPFVVYGAREMAGVCFELESSRPRVPGESMYERLGCITNDETLTAYRSERAEPRPDIEPEPERPEHLLRRAFLGELERRGFVRPALALDTILRRTPAKAGHTHQYRADMAWLFGPDVLVQIEVDEKEKHPEPRGRLDEILAQTGASLHFVLRICTARLAATHTRPERPPMVEYEMGPGGRRRLRPRRTPEFDRRLELLVDAFCRLVHCIESGWCDGVRGNERCVLDIGWD